MSNTTSNGQFKIDKGIDIPPLLAGRRRKYPFGQMKIGDSFFMDDSTKKNSVRYAASYYGIRNKGFKFTVRREGDGVRVWRIPMEAK